MEFVYMKFKLADEERAAAFKRAECLEKKAPFWRRWRRTGIIAFVFGMGLLCVVGQLKASPAADRTEQTGKDPFPKPRNGSAYVIAHRGAHQGIPENTLAAYRKAIELGCDFVEIDARRTKDGRIVSMHNARIDACVPGKSGRIRDFTLAELKAMDIGSRMGPEWKNERIPTVEEILKLCQGRIGIYLDLKEKGLVPDLLALLKKYDMERDVVWYIPASFMQTILEIKRRCPDCLPMPDPGPARNIPRVVERAHPRVLATDMGELNERYMRLANQYGVMVFVDEDQGGPAEWRKILDWGTQGIQTDDPAGLIQFLKARSQGQHRYRVSPPRRRSCPENQ